VITIMIAKAAIRASDANRATPTPERMAFVSASKLFGPKAMLRAKQAGMNHKMVCAVMGATGWMGNRSFLYSPDDHSATVARGIDEYPCCCSKWAPD